MVKCMVAGFEFRIANCKLLVLDYVSRVEGILVII